MKAIILLVLILYVFLIRATGSVIIQNLPDYCKRESDYLFQCEGLNFGHFKEIEFSISNKFDSEDFNYTNSNFYTIPKNAFRISKPVDYFYMSNCGLKEIHKWNFYSGHSNVKTSKLFLDHNQIEKIPSEVFENLPNLKQLKLKNNKISILEINCFKGLTYLQYLWLSANRIETLRENTFHDLGNLEFIDLSENYIQFLPGDVFQNNRKLTEIYLHENHLKIIDLNVVKSTAALQFMLRHFNRSVQATPISIFNVPSLLKVNVSGNYFPYISSASLSQMTKLRVFRASRANLTYIEDGAFSHMPYLEELYLDNNLLEAFDFNLVSNMKTLKSIYINKNRLKAIEYRVLMAPPKSNLSFVGLEDNLFSCHHRIDVFLYLKGHEVGSDLNENCPPEPTTPQDEEYSMDTTTQEATFSDLSTKSPATSDSTTQMSYGRDKSSGDAHNQTCLKETAILALTIFIAVLNIFYGIVYIFCIFFRRRLYTERNYNEREVTLHLVEDKS